MSRRMAEREGVMGVNGEITLVVWGNSELGSHRACTGWIAEALKVNYAYSTVLYHSYVVFMNDICRCRIYSVRCGHRRGQNSHELAIRPLKFNSFVPSVGLGLAFGFALTLALIPHSFRLSFPLLLSGNEARRSFIHSHSFRRNRSFPQVPSEEIE
jgi:hypothetical protein